MGKFFSDVVEQALRDIYYDVSTGRKAFRLWREHRRREMGTLPVFWPAVTVAINMSGAVMAFWRMMTRQLI